MLSRLLASDPGLNRLRLAVQAVVTIGAAMAAEWGFVLLTGAMQIDGAGLPAAVVAAQHHGVTVIAVMIGAVVGMIGTRGLQALREAGIENVDQLVTRAMLDPVLARRLLEKVPAASVMTPAQDSAFARAVRRSIAPAIATAANARSVSAN